jgi:octaprenyl-diphosphate synthase
MNDYKNKALLLLQEFPESEYKKSLETMIEFVVARKI